MIRRGLALGAVALVVAMGPQPAAALVCGIVPEDPAVIERTIAGRQPMGGDFDVVVIGVVEGIGPTDADGYREVTLDLGVVLRGEAPREYAVKYPASADDARSLFITGATYLVAVESEGWTGGPTTSECSATSRVIDPEQIQRFVAMAPQPLIYNDAVPTRVDDVSQPLLAVGALLAAMLVTSVGLVARSRR